MLAPLIATLLLIAGHAWASKSTNACCVPNFVRIALTRPHNTLENELIETPFTGTLPPKTCPLVNGVEGIPVCLLTVAISLPADPSLLTNNALCPYLSPANVNLQQNSFRCVGYLDPLIPFSCDGGAMPQCRFNNVSDFVPDVPAANECSARDPEEFKCLELTPGDPSLCPATAIFNSVSYPLFASLCSTGITTTIPTPYAGLTFQYFCNAALDSLVVDQQAGCYLINTGSLCSDGIFSARCYYAIPKPASY
jgi:hypothetical protein